MKGARTATVKVPPHFAGRCSMQRIVELINDTATDFYGQLLLADIDRRNRVFVGGVRPQVETSDLRCQAEKTDCERLKASEKTAYEIAKEATQAQFALKKLDCERLKVSERAGCEINQQWLRDTENLELANIRGSAHIDQVAGAVAVTSIWVSRDLDKIDIALRLSGNSQVTAAFEFTPLNAGHIACVAQWSGRVVASVGIENAALTITAVQDQLKPGAPLVYRTDPLEESVKIKPSPAEALLAQNPQMVLACPIPAALLANMSMIAPPIGLVLPIKLLLADQVTVKVPSQLVTLPFEAELDGRSDLKGKIRMIVGEKSLIGHYGGQQERQY